MEHKHRYEEECHVGCIGLIVDAGVSLQKDGDDDDEPQNHEDSDENRLIIDEENDKDASDH